MDSSPQHQMGVRGLTSRHFNSGPSTHWAGGWVGPRAGHDPMGTTEILPLARDLLQKPAQSLITIVTELPRICMGVPG
jgi:hypothetical protein